MIMKFQNVSYNTHNIFIKGIYKYFREQLCIKYIFSYTSFKPLNAKDSQTNEILKRSRCGYVFSLSIGFHVDRWNWSGVIGTVEFLPGPTIYLQRAAASIDRLANTHGGSSRVVNLVIALSRTPETCTREIYSMGNLHFT